MSIVRNKARLAAGASAAEALPPGAGRPVDAPATEDLQARRALLPEDERAWVVREWNRTEAAYPRGWCIHELFQRQVERAPDATALAVEDRRVSYGELNRRANRLAHHLRSLGVGPDVRVAICVERSPGMIVALLAVLKAGGAYVPLDPAYPRERLAYLLADSAPAAVLTQTHLRDRAGHTDAPVLELDAAVQPWADQPETDPERGALTPAHLAYVIYTSGSTGRPKGVMVAHASLANLVHWHCAAFGVGPGSRSSSVASLGFDAAAWEIWPVLAAGGELAMPGPGRADPETILEWWGGQALDVSFLPTPLAEHAFARGVPAGAVKTLLVGGDRLRRVPRGPMPFDLVNNYGPTETTVVATSGRVRGSAPPAIGRPISNTRAYVLDEQGEPVPVGVAGELYIGGAQVARGYLGRPEQTAERFVADPFGGEPGARLYRTGDLCRWTAEGTLEFVGRLDQQVKVRGFRIEPGEVEARLAEHPAVDEAVVVARADPAGGTRLVAYWVGAPARAETMRAHLGGALPAYMVPSAFVRVERFPLSPNGKLDRAALPEPADEAHARRSDAPPVGETERVLAAIWSEVLGIARVGRHDHFFELGGHSLSAGQVISRVRQLLQVEVALGELFTRPVLRDFAREMERAARAELPSIEPADRDGPVPLSFAQQRLWFLEQLGEIGSAYHIFQPLRLRGEMDRAALVRALDAIVARHQALRTTFAQMDGVPVQRIAPAGVSGFHRIEHDLSAVGGGAQAELVRLMAEEEHAPFDLERGPLIRGRLIRLAADDHALLLTLHHIVGDGWSMGVLFGELSALYAAHREGSEADLPALPVQYADYAVWQRRWMEGDAFREQAGYWTRTLAGAPELLELPTDHPRPAEMDRDGAWLGVELDEELTAALTALGRRHGATLYMTLLAGWAVVLSRLSGQHDVMIGSPIAGRGRREIEGLIGFFVNTLALRLDLSGAPTVAELLGRIRQRTLEAQHHQDVPFEQVVERLNPARSLSHSPLFQVMFTWQNTPGGDGLRLPGLAVDEMEAPARTTAKFDLSLSLREAGGRVVGSVTYAVSLFDRSTLERWIGYLRRVLLEMADDDSRRVERLALMPESERRRVLEEWNRTDAPGAAACVHETFEAQAERTPEAVALTFEDRSITYARLNRSANRLAHHLRRQGVRPGVRVAVCMERSPELIIALLGVMKSGGAYVPLDPGYPEDRLRHMLADSAPAALLVHAHTAARFAGGTIPLVDLDADAGALAAEPAANPGRDAVGLTPDDLVYVLYTSGSTGRPKGVMVEHRALANVMGWMDRAWPLGPGDVVLQKTPVSFDASARELYPPLLAGARMVIARPEGHRDPAYLIETIRREGVTTLHFVPSMFGSLLEEPGVEACTSIVRVVCGGEALPAALVRRAAQVLPDAVVHNVYGPTEAAVDVTWMPGGAELRGAHVPIGRPMDHCRAYLLDRAGQPVPPGVAGELYLGGAQLARGYLGRAAMTAERFVPDPLSPRRGARLYRTGDLGRWLPDGSIEFLGRNDHQVKVRGFRIEPGEVEARLAEHPHVREAVVLVREDAAGDRRLVTYWTGRVVAAETLRAHVSEALPAHMVPAAFVRLEQWPRTPNGKLDRAALPAPASEAYARRGYQAPVGRTERMLAEIWAELLGVERVGRRDHFFELGGHSLLAVRLMERMRRRGLHAGVRALFLSPVLADFAHAIGSGGHAAPLPAPLGPLVELTQAELDGIVAGVPGGAGNLQDIYPLAPLQEGILFHHLLTREGDPYLSAILFRFDSREHRDRYLAALQAVVNRHDILRTSLAWEGLREPVQVVWRRAPLQVEEVEMDPADGDVEDQLYARFDPRQYRIDVRTAPLMRVYTAHDRANGRWPLLLLRHHLVSDHTTLEVLQAEIEAHLAGRADSLAPPLPFRGYVEQARLGVSRDEHREFFTALLGDVREPTAPFDVLDVRGDGSAMREARLDVEGRLAVRLRARARLLGVGAASVFHVAWARVVARASGRDDVVFGTLLFGRMHAGEGADRVMGPFINTLPIRIHAGGVGVEACVRRTHALLGTLLHHEHASLALAQRCSGVEAPAPLFTALLNYRHSADDPSETPAAAAEMAAGGMRVVRAEERTNYPLALAVDDLGDGFRLKGQVAHESLDPALVCGLMHRALEGLVEALETAPERAVGTIDVLPASERVRLLEAWNRTGAAYPAESCIHELFERQAERDPDATALVSGDERLSYGELNRRANRLAHHLRSLGVGPDARVAICLERGMEMVAALLAVLKAGGAYVPLDPAYPAGRLAFMVADSAPILMLTQASLAERFAGAGVPVLELDASAPPWASEPETNPERGALTPEHLAYVIYTSGSTGRPKGVMVPHRGLCNVAAAQQRDFGVGPGDRVLQFASLSFDAAAFEVVMALASGAALCIAPHDELLPGPGLLALLRRHAVTLVTLPPSALAALPVADLPALRAFTVAGEALPAELVGRWGARHRLLNLYGPTEATIWSTAAECADTARRPDIGSPIANVRAYVLDAGLEPLPAGVPGELYVGGAGVARGYLGRPALTAGRFVPDPFGGEPGARLYRTGDRMRRLPDGRLDYIGRVDHQVKVRGFRIEPGEIEARLAEHPHVREAVVLVREDAPGDPRLVAYCVADRAVDVESLRAHVAERLPAYMVPAACVRLDALPLTPNGKLDRAALPAPDAGAYAMRGYEPPVGAVEELVAGVWAEVLGAGRVGRWDDFFDLGGHSLLAVRVISRVRQVLRVKAAVGDLFAHPVLKDFARELETAARAELPPIERAGREGPVPLSFAQQRLWFMEQLGNLGSTFHLRAPLRLRGPLDRAALVRALDAIVARHEPLRTTFTQVDGVARQRIAPADIGFRLAEHDLGGRADAEGELERLIADEARAPFHLERGPLIRGRLIQLAADDHVLLVTLHHIVSDGWSMGVLFDELSALYTAHREGREAHLPALPVQYADYAAWQRRWVDGDVLREQAEYWTQTLSGAPELLELPTDHPRPAQVDHAGALLDVELDEELTAGLKSLGRRHGTTPFMTLLAGWAVVLSRLAGQDDVVVGTPAANRGRREIEGLIGFFVNTLALRLDLSGEPTVAELLARVKERALAAQHHPDIPFEQVVERLDPARSLSHTPVFQVMFSWQETLRGGGLTLPGLDVGRVGTGYPEVRATYDLSLALREAEDRIVGHVVYATALFERETVTRWVGYLRRVLREMVAGERRGVRRLALMPEPERVQVLEEWNGPRAAYPDDACVHEIFQAQVRRTPGAEAVVFAGERLTYAELNARANRLAHHLRSLGVGPDARVGICVERSLEMVTGLLAVLKAGGAYVPLDPAYPVERLAYMLADSAPAAVLTQTALRGRLASTSVPVLELDAAAPAWATRPAADPERGALTPAHLAYVTYTSGSTGRPKGVMNPHRGLVNRLAWMQARHGLELGEGVLQNSSFSFDASVFEIFWPLTAGGRVVLPRPDGHRDPEDLIRLIATEGVSTAYFVCSMLQLFVEYEGVERCTALTRVLCGGEALSPALARRVRERLPRARLHDLYGPTESAVSVSGPVAAPDESVGSVPIGRPVPNVRVYLLDAAGEPVPVGVAGELHVGGAQLARGYLGRPELTAERFVADRFGGEPGARLYRTGDRARWRRNGTLVFLGRIDFQVKVRGFRIEPGEIEERLREHAGVREAVVATREDTPGDTRLVAYWVGEAVDAEPLRAWLGEALPAYMVPAAYVRLEQMPRTPNGKLDRAALPAPDGGAYAARGYEAPLGETEQALAEIWAQVLGVQRVGRRDDFFALGGHSLLVMQVIARMRRKGLHAEVRSLFTAPTLAALAAEVGGAPREVEVPANRIPAGCDAITPEMLPLVALDQAEIDAAVATVPGGAANVQDIYPLAPHQEGVLFHHLMAGEGDPYLLGVLYAVENRARLDRYLDALQAVVNRHDILRTGVVWEGLREPVQVVWRKAPLRVHQVELDPASGDAADQLYARFDPRHHRIDVREAPLMRVCIAADHAGGRWLLLLLRHHLVSDHLAADLLRDEVEAHLCGRADSLPQPLPFRDHVARARLGTGGDEHRAFFTELLGDVDQPTAPFGLLDVRGDGSGIAQAGLDVEARLAARLRERARALGVTAATLCHVAWARVLARASGRDDVVFGTVLFGRMQGGEGADRTMGPFINTLPVRIHAGSVGVEECARRTHALLAKLLHHEHASLALAQRCSAVEAPAPLFTALLNYRHGDAAAAARTALDGMRMIRGEERSNYPLTLAVDDLGEGFRLTAKVRAPLDAGRVCALMHTALEGLAEALETDPERAVGSIDVLPADERLRVLKEWNRTDAVYPAELCIHHLFEAQAARTPHAPAVVCEGRTLTYAELNARANRLAHHLVRRGVGPDVRVGVCLDRGPEMIVAVLAVLKAGGTYLPLDPEYPEGRLRHILEDGAPALLLLQASLAERFAGVPVPRIRIDADAAEWARQPEADPARGALAPDHLAYVIHTSGSTGRPKGVMNPHRALVNRLCWGRRVWGIGADDAVLCKTSLSFDGSVREIFLPLMAGARVVLAPPGGHRDPRSLLEVIGRENVTTLNLVPSLLRVLLDAPEAENLRGVARILCGGDALPAALVERVRQRLPGVELHNLYGPSEAATALASPLCVAGPGHGGVPAGAPIDNTRVYVLDGRGEPVPAGVAGELYVGGAGVARGYLGRAGQTAERFVPDPFGTAGARLYRTGDLGRWLSDGTIEFLGRTDFQVKVRGFRVEPGEVEARLAEHPKVREAVVLAREDGAGGAGEKRLVAYYVGVNGTVEAESLRAHLAGRLPEYMVPAAYVRLPRLPLTPSGKLDRRALPAPGADAFAARAYQAPADETEQALAGIWAEVLRVERVGRHDHFFELGGHSLLAVQVTSRVRQLLDVDVALGELFARPVLKDFAQVVLDAQLAQFDPDELAELAELLRDAGSGD